MTTYKRTRSSSRMTITKAKQQALNFVKDTGIVSYLPRYKMRKTKPANPLRTRIHKILLEKGVQIKVSFEVHSLYQTYHDMDTGTIVDKVTKNRQQELYSVKVTVCVPDKKQSFRPFQTFSGESRPLKNRDAAIYCAYIDVFSNMRFQESIACEDEPFSKAEIESYVAGIVAKTSTQTQKLEIL